MIDHHISHTIPFDKITKCTQVKAINISRVRSSPCFPNVHLVIKVELELPPATADSSGSWGHCSSSVVHRSHWRLCLSRIFAQADSFTITVLEILDLNIGVHLLYCPRFWTSQSRQCCTSLPDQSAWTQIKLLQKPKTSRDRIWYSNGGGLSEIFA